MLAALIGLFSVLLVWYIYRGTKDPLKHIPGPRGVPFLGNSHQIDSVRSRYSFYKWYKEYGPVFKVKTLYGYLVVVSGYDVIYDVLVTRGKHFSDRVRTFRLNVIAEKTGLIMNNVDSKWKIMRQMNHRVLGNYGKSVSYLETLINDLSQEMCGMFKKKHGIPFDPMERIRLTALKTIGTIIIGENLSDDDPLLHDLNKLAEELAYACQSFSLSLMLLDFFPVLINIPTSGSKRLKEYKQLESRLWEEMVLRQGNTKESLIKTALSAVAEKNTELTENDVKIMVSLMILASVNTSSRAFYFWLNVFARRPDIQMKLHEEIPTTSEIYGAQIHQKHQMPYLQATILETLRCFTTSPSGGVLHAAVGDEELFGFGRLPKGTQIMINHWVLHHDEAFWDEPSDFRPERFLDSSGNLVSVDHPNRKHLMPFGAGLRVCSGENFAMMRLYLWAFMIAQTFTASAVADDEEPWLDPRTHAEESMLNPKPCKIILKPRY